MYVKDVFVFKFERKYAFYSVPFNVHTTNWFVFKKYPTDGAHFLQGKHSTGRILFINKKAFRLLPIKKKNYTVDVVTYSNKKLLCIA